MTGPVHGILRSMRDPDDASGKVPPDAAELVRRAQSGDRAAFDRLVERHAPRVWKVAWRIVRNRDDADDVAQEVFLTAFRTLSSFRGESRLSTWLHRIAVTRALNHQTRAAERMRRASDSLESERADGPDGIRPEVERAAGLASARQTPLHALETKELMRRLADCLQRLPAPWRAIVALRDAESLAYDEIASVLRIELGTVRSRLARARAALRECVEGRGA